MAPKIDLTGQRFNRLTVLREAPRKIYGGVSVVTWLCRCDCGKETTVITGRLRNGGTKSCGCYKADNFRGPRNPKHNLTGQKFGRLTGIRFADFNGSNGGARWLFACDCGNTVITMTRSVFNGNTTSCGCWNQEQRTKHGNAVCVELPNGDYGPKTEYYLWSSARLRASKKGLPFSIEMSDIVIPQNCPVLGIPIVKGIRRFHDNSPSLDRIVPELGYVRGNVCVISWRANVIKGFGTAEEHRKIADYIESSLVGDVSRESEETQRK